jgi:hypothetical protein
VVTPHEKFDLCACITDILQLRRILYPLSIKRQKTNISDKNPY